MASVSETKAGPVEVSVDGARGLSRETFAVFGHRPFALLWGNTITFALSQSIQMFTFAWLAIDIAGDHGVALWSGFTVGSGTVVGLVIAALGLPVLLFGLYAGILTDRLDRRVLLFGTQLVGIALAAGAATLVALGTLNIWGIFGLAFVLGCTTAFGMPVRQAIVPSLVSPERVLNAVTLMNVSAQVAQAGAAVSGIVIQFGGIESAFAAQAVLLTLGLLVLIPIRVPNVRTTTQRRIREDLREGLSFVIHHPGIRTLMIVLLATALSMAGTFQALLPKIAVDEWEAGAFRASMLFTIMLVGTLVTSVVLASFRRVDRAGFYFLCTLVAGGVLNVALGLSPWYSVALVIMFITGFNAGIFINLNMALVQAHTPNAIMGRVMSIYQMCMAGAMPIGALVAGPMADVVGAPYWFAIGGALLFLLGVVVIATQPALRRMSSAPDPAGTAAAVAAGS
ncbi:MAG: MFS transporter [Dehalococcoidia bacterium]|nr:MFS transporter [Chloroflexota bacterium]MXZ88313.1 MFS transporter [Dehalococcoidia bacterium]MYI86261.1 MFS transporter [Dehalococcoidia bacterium]